MTVQTEPEHSFEAIPIKPMEGSTKIKTAIEMIKYVLEHGLDLDCVVTLITEKKVNQLPDPLALRSDILVPFTMQMVFRKLNDKEYQILRHFTFDQKLDVRLLKSAVCGDLYLLDYGKKFRTGQAGCQLLLEKGLPKLKRNSFSGFSKQNKNVLEPTLLHHPLSRLCRTSQRFFGNTKIDAQPVSGLSQSHQEAQEVTHQEAQEAIQEADSDSQESQEATKEAESDSSSSSSPSTSSPIRKLRDTRAIVREVTEAFGLMREPLAETCAECTTALDHIQGLLHKALQ